MAVEVKEQCKKCFHFQVCASVLKNDLYIREMLMGEKEPECKQFVEVVRCKDCYLGENCTCVCCEDGEMVHCRKHHKHMDANAFCSDGWRETNEKMR